MGFTGKRVWITGASSGIGEALAYELAKSGAQLILSSRNQTKLSQVLVGCINADQHRIVALDLSQADACQAVVTTTLLETGPVDILINNAGISQRSLAKDTPLAIDRRILEVNFFATVAMTKAILPSMLARQSGHIVTISSLVGKFGAPLRSAYCASKHAIHGFMESLRAETWADGITVTIVCPGFIKTDVSINALTADGSAQGTMDTAHARGLAPEHCARKITAAIIKRKSEVYIGGKEKLSINIKRFFPGAFDRIIRK